MSTNEKTVSKVEETKDKKAEVKAENKKEELKKTDKAAETEEDEVAVRIAIWDTVKRSFNKMQS